MSYDFRLPNITGTTEKEQIAQLKNYLLQFIPQLQWAMNTMDTQKTAIVSTIVRSGASNPSGASSTDAEATFSAIKSLIIKSADIVEAYYEEMNERFRSDYVAVSDFGTYKQEAAQEISKTSDDITQAFSNIQTIETNVGDLGANLHETKNSINSNIGTLSDNLGTLDSNLKDLKDGTEKSIGEISGSVTDIGKSLSDTKAEMETAIGEVNDNIGKLNTSIIEVTANIKSGLLDYDENEVPIYGLEVGQRNLIDGVETFNKYARFTAGRLSFYDAGGNEVAYISDYKLFITHAEVTGSLKLGGFLIDTTKGITMKWVGRR